LFTASIAMKQQICNVGACFTDLIAYAPRMPGPGETLVGTKFATGFGGKGANQAVQAARLGAKVMMVSKLGDDTFGNDTLANFKEQGVDATWVTRVAGMSSGVAPITVNEQTGQNAIIIVPGALDHLTGADVEAAREGIRHCGLLMVQLEAPMEATIAALRIAREEGLMTLLNTAPAKTLPEEIWPLCDIVCPNEPELQTLTGMPTGDDDEVTAAARELIKRGAKTVLVTLGSRGCALFEGDAAGKFVATTKVKPVDTTGAGDSFLGALAAKIVIGQSLEEAMPFANKVASVSVTREGTQKSFPSASDLNDA
jgi:ribokinase